MSNSNAGSTVINSLPQDRTSAASRNHAPNKLASCIRAWWPVALGIAVIMVESTAMMGADHTSHPLRLLVEFFVGPMPDARWEIVHHYIRKSGHFVGYGLLCLTWLRAWRLTFPRLPFIGHAGLALLGTAIVASCDEWHQAFLPNRTSSPWDVLLDCCGALTMTLFTCLILRLFRPTKHGF